MVVSATIDVWRTVSVTLLLLACIDTVRLEPRKRQGSSARNETVFLGAVLTDVSHVTLMNNTIEAYRANTSSLAGVQIKLLVEHMNLTEHLKIIDTICNMMLPNGINALISVLQSDNKVDVHIATGFVSMISKFTGLPVISLTEAKSLTTIDDRVGFKDTQSTYLHLGASITDQCKAMLSFLQYYEWYHFLIVTTAIPNHDLFINVLESLTERHFGNDNFVRNGREWEICDRIEINMDGNLTAQVKLVVESDCTIVLLFCAEEEARKIMKIASSYHLLREGYVWIGAETILEKASVGGLAPNEFPPGLLAVKFQSIYYDTNRAVQDATSKYLKGLDKYLRNDMPIDIRLPENCWVNSMKPSTRSEKFLTYLTGRTLDGGTQDMIFDNDGNTANPHVAIMNVDAFQKWDQVGIWSQKGSEDSIVINDVTWIGGHHQQPDGLTPHRHITFTSIPEGSYVSLIKLSEEECTAGARCKQRNETGDYVYYCCIGLCIDLLLKLSEDLGFNYDLYIVDDQKFGALENGTWNGIVGDILKGKADASIATLLDTADRSAVIDTSVSFMKSGISVLVKKVEGAVPSDAFLAPFDYTVWLLLTVGIVQAVALAVFLFECFSPGGYDRNISGPRVSKFTFGSSLWIVWALLFNNTVPLKPPRSYTAKFMTNMWGCFSLIFIAMYTANLVAHMIREAPDDMVDGFPDDRLQHPKHYSHPLKFGTIRSTSVEQYIKTVNQEMQDHMEPYNFERAPRAIEAVKSGFMDAFIYDEAALKDLAAKDQDCSLHVVGKTVGETGYTIALTKGSHWTHSINEMIIEYTDSGFIQTLVDKWLTSMCDSKLDSIRKPLGIEHSSGVFMLLLGGTCASVLIFFGEHLFFRFLRNYFTKKFAKKELVAVVAEAMAQSIYTPSRQTDECPCSNWECQQLSNELNAALARLTELEKMIWTSRNGSTTGYARDMCKGKRKLDRPHWLPLSQNEAFQGDHTDERFSSDSDSQTSEKNFTNSFDNIDNLDILYDMVESSV